MATKLHVGKLNKRVESSVTEAFEEWAIIQAHAQGLAKADFLRELLYIGATNEMYSFHVAKDKAEAFKSQLANVMQDSRSDAGDKS
jgi:hypothetical protein